MSKENISKNKINIMEKISGINSKNLQLIINIVIIILINIAGVTLNARFDLTRNKTYSLSQKSKDIVSNLSENLSIKVLFSKDLPAEHSTLFRYLKDLLEEYDYYGNRYFSYEIVGEEDIKAQARDFGIRPVTSREFVDDQIKTRQTYMGIVIQHADLIEKIDTVVNPVGLEYEITSRIEKMTNKVDALLKLKEPITLKLFLDREVKKLSIDGIEDLEQKVRDAAAKANVNNYGKIKFQLIESLPPDQKEAIMKKYGLNKLVWKGGVTKTGEKIKGGEGIFGIVFEMGDKFRNIKINVAQSLFGNYVIVGLENFQDKINDTIGSLLNANKKIGYIAGHGTININDEQSRDGGGLFKKLLSDIYDIRSIDLAKESIPDSIETVIINGPKDQFSDAELFKIDQFLMRGKSLIIFYDSFNEVQMPGGNSMFRRGQPVVLPVNTGLEKLLKSYGITVNKDIVLDKNCAKISFGDAIRDYPLIPVIRKSGLNKDNIITKHLPGAMFIKVSSISSDENKLKESGIVRTDLVNTSNESWLMKGRINFNPFMMGISGGKDMKSYTIASLFSGKFRSYFKNREVPLDGKEQKKKLKGGMIKSTDKLAETVEGGKSRIILVTSSEITRSGFLMYSRKVLARGSRSEVFSNDHFLHSLVDYFSGNIFVPEMKSKSLEYNPLEKTGERKRFVLKTINIAGVPVLVIIMGLFVWRGRLSRRKRILKEFTGEVGDE